MAALGGSIESINFNGREFPIAADAEVQLKTGGFENEVQANGNGTARLIKTRVPFSVDGAPVEIDHDRNDLEYLQELSNAIDFFPVAVTLASSTTYQGSAQIVGEMQASTQNATASVSLMGPGILTQQ